MYDVCLRSKEQLFGYNESVSSQFRACVAGCNLSGINMEHTAVNKGLYLLMSTSLTVSMSLNAITPIQPLFIIENGASNVELGLILAVSSMFALVSRIPLSIFS